jgi:hypothetical protein
MTAMNTKYGLHFARQILKTIAVLAGLAVVSTQPLLATPPFGHPDQPYDRLPGTLQTSHTPWARPLSGGQLEALFICPYNNSREVVEIAQRLDVKYTVIMNAGHSAWADGYFEGDNATPLKGVEARTVLDDLSRRRLDLGHRYDVIVIAKVSWEVIPEHIRELILGHVARGAGLVYVSPNRLKSGWNRTEPADNEDSHFTELFESGFDNNDRARIVDALPIDVMPLHLLQKPQDYKPLPSPRHEWQQTPLCLSLQRHGKGRILGLDYFDETIARRTHSSLTPSYHHPRGDHDEVVYDLNHALLARGILWATDRLQPTPISISIEAPETELPTSSDGEGDRLRWSPSSPAAVVWRSDFETSRIVVETPAGTPTASVVATLRYRSSRLRDNVTGGPGQSTDMQTRTIAPSRVILEQKLDPDAAGKSSLKIPMLARGTYLLDVQTFDAGGAVVDFASKSFRVESQRQIADVKTGSDRYQRGDEMRGTVTTTDDIGPNERIVVSVNDMWGRLVHRGPAQKTDATSFEFRVPVEHPLSELWDVHASLVDDDGVVDRRTIPVPILNNTFDDFLFMLIFAPTPGQSNWKGALHARRLRKYGINAAYTYLIYSQHEQFFHHAREHLRSVVYAEHSGEYLSPADKNTDYSVEQTTYDLAEISRMLRRVADTGEKLDPKEFPYRMGHFSADWFNSRIDNYKLAGRFGSPFYTLTGENYLLGEFNGVENSGFAPTTTKKFQKWSRAEYANDLDSLNREWGSDLKSWDDVRGIMLKAAVEQNQMPRWVDFRYFMRSRVWSQFFIDWTDMMRSVIPNARTGRVGHDHHDFSRYRRQMTSSKLYLGQEKFAEWRHALTAELPQSFGKDEGFLMAPQSMIRWTHDLQSQTNRQRWPWMVLMLGLDGFDWERGLEAPTLGGEHCFTPDYSEPLPYFRDISDEVLTIQRGIGKLTMAAKPNRSKVALLWSPRNHYISRLQPFEENGFSGTWMSNVSVIGGAVSDALSLMNSIRIRPTIISPEDVVAGDLQRRGFKALILPYNKGMSRQEAAAIRKFVAAGGLLIADNDPATYSQHGRKLDKPELADLFPATDRIHIQTYGKGHAAYLPNVINGYTDRLENDDHSGADSVADLLAKHAAQRPFIQLLDQNDEPRRDTLMRVFHNGETTLVGLLRAQTAAADHVARTTVKLPAVRHIWDIRSQTYLGQTDTLQINLDQQPRFLALLPDDPGNIRLQADTTVFPGATLTLRGVVGAEQPDGDTAMSHAIHVEVFSPDGTELEWHRRNVVFRGSAISVALPISLSAARGRYRIVVEHAITGATSETTFDVIQK